MPDSRTDSLVQLAQDTARRITGSHTAWMAYLQTAARLYKYPYHEQLLIFAQRPQATACAGYEVWKNTMRRYVRRGSTLWTSLAGGNCTAFCLFGLRIIQKGCVS